jgi:2-dehydropantoate 2-reductase
MLQDLERGRPMEIDALLGAVVELGRLTGKPIPLCEAVLALVRGRARQAGLYLDSAAQGNTQSMTAKFGAKS